MKDFPLAVTTDSLSLNADRLALEDPARALYVSVALGLPQEEPYQYAVPPERRSQVGVGKRVRVPLRTETRIGYIVGVSDEKVIASPRDLIEVIDAESLLTEPLLKLTRWMSDYYSCSWGQAIEAAMPSPFKKGKTTMRLKTPKVQGPARDYIHATPLDHVLTPSQKSAYESISRALDRKEFRTFLLHGVTGSGKTEIYLTLIKKLLEESRGSIVLVPEISLTPQTTDRFESRFRDEVVVLHSRISAGRRLHGWHRLREGKAHVVVGARSAVFSPVKHLGLIVIDEEHDDSYKQDETPRYDAWLVAEKRCEIEKAVLIRGSATPRLESTWLSLGTKGYLSLPQRIEDRPLPLVTLIDMRREVRGRRVPVFSGLLEKAVLDALAAKEQVMLFLNRRGFAPVVSCPACGFSASCRRCRVTLVFHFDRQKLLCHLCNREEKPPKICPACGKAYLYYGGIGTEKIESETCRLFPRSRIARMDTDTTARVGAHERILGAFRKKEIDILLGTQMIAKGHDFPGVSVIGVISADTALHVPDFRSAERTFDLLTQVAGRAGRGSEPGKVFIQTYIPSHYAIQAAQHHHYKEFYEKEIAFRRELGLPPWKHLVQLILVSSKERRVVRKALELKKLIEPMTREQGIEILGPAPCLVSRLRGRYYWNLYFKGESVPAINALLKSALKSFDRRGVRLTLDADPR